MTEQAYDLINDDYHDSQIIYLCNYEDDIWCTYVKYLQFKLGQREIMIYDDDNLVEVVPGSLVIVSNTDNKEYDILLNMEPIHDNGSYTIYVYGGESINGSY